MKSFVFSCLVCLVVFGMTTNGMAVPKAMCPDKVIDTGTVEGTYLGFFEGEEMFSVGIQIDGSADTVYLVASEEEATKYFGNSVGKKVSVNYEVSQFGIGEGDEFTCERLTMLKSGKVLGAPKGKTAKQEMEGSYVFQKKGMTGELISTPSNNGYKVVINTATSDGSYTCEATYICKKEGNIFNCVFDEEDNTDLNTKIRINGKQLTISDDLITLSMCGGRASMTGKYVKQ